MEILLFAVLFFTLLAVSVYKFIRKLSDAVDVFDDLDNYETTPETTNIS